VNPTCQFVFQRCVNGALALKTRETNKGFGRHLNPKMRFAAFSPSRMAMMAMALVDNLELLGIERGSQFALNPSGHFAHDASLRPFHLRGDRPFSRDMSSAMTKGKALR